MALKRRKSVVPESDVTVTAVPEGNTVVSAVPKKLKRKPRAEAGMMMPVFVATFILAITVLVLMAFLVRPIW